MSQSSSDEDFFVRKRVRTVPSPTPSDSSSSSCSSESSSSKRLKSRSPIRSRRLSITPPPGPSAHQLEAAVELVKKALAAPKSDDEEDDEDEDEEAADVTLELDDPELARLYRGKNAKAVREKARLAELKRRQQASVKPKDDDDCQIITMPKTSQDVIDLSSSSPAPSPPPQPTDSEPRLTLHLVSASGSSHPVQVRPTTKISTIVSHYPIPGIKLRLDGQFLPPESTVQEGDLEDDDQVEVVQ